MVGKRGLIRPSLKSNWWSKCAFAGSCLFKQTCLPWPYLQDGLIVDIIEDGSVDLTWLQCNPIQHWHSELGLNWFLDLHRCLNQEYRCESSTHRWLNPPDIQTNRMTVLLKDADRIPEFYCNNQRSNSQDTDSSEERSFTNENCFSCWLNQVFLV